MFFISKEKYQNLIIILLLFFPIHSAIFYTNIDEAQLNDPYADRDEIARPFFELNLALSKLGYEIKKASLPFNEPLGNFDYFFFMNIPGQPYLNMLKELRQHCISSIWEPPTVCIDLYNKDFRPYIAKILVMTDDHVDDKNFIKFFYPQPQLEMIEDVPDFDKKKFCTLIAGAKESNYPLELYSERKNIIGFYEIIHEDDFEFYGPGWPQTPCYKGTVPTKKTVLKNYRFCICYENTRDLDGYITEKIFDCFVSGCVPVYRGAGNITDYVPKNCFIDRRNFTNNHELHKFLKNIDKKTYEGYLKNIKNYLSSEKAFLFSTEYFIDIILSLMLPNYDKTLIFNQKQIEMLRKAHTYYESIQKMLVKPQSIAKSQNSFKNIFKAILRFFI